MSRALVLAVSFSIAISAVGCDDSNKGRTDAGRGLDASRMDMSIGRPDAGGDAGRDAGRDAGSDAGPDSGRCSDYDPLRQPYFGDLHVHTSQSYDSYVIGNTRNDPAAATDFAAGMPVGLPPFNEDGTSERHMVRLDTPLDFVAITDHSEFIGEVSICLDDTSDPAAYNSQTCVDMRNMTRLEENVLGVDIAFLYFGMAISTRTPLSFCSVKSGDAVDGGVEDCDMAAVDAWSRMQAVANERDDKCDFTALIGYEWTGQQDWGTGGTAMKHRNVIFRGSVVPPAPITYYDVAWAQELDEQLQASCRADGGCEVLAIPHNSNQSSGLQFEPIVERTADGTAVPFDVTSAQLRRDMEPLAEIFQTKESSECFNGFQYYGGAADELCEFERKYLGTDLCDYCGEGETPDADDCITTICTETELPAEDGGTYTVYEPEGCARRCGVDEDPDTDGCTDCAVECAPGQSAETGDDPEQPGDQTCNFASWDMARNALKIGMEEWQRTGVNPFQVGFIASTDTHNGTPGYVKESTYEGHHGTVDDDPEQRLNESLLSIYAIDVNPAGIAGVWAEENTRGAIFDALRRRETWATSGPRIVPRFFGGWELSDGICGSTTRVADAYAAGVPMGSELPAASTSAPRFFAWATADSASAPLQRLQIIKVWIDATDGPQEQVYDITSGDFGSAVVDTDTCTYSGGPSASDLCQYWVDPDFNSTEPAAYYARAVEVPTCRWTTYQCNLLRGRASLSTWCALQRDAFEGCCDVDILVQEDGELGDVPTTIQERAWTSPIWYTPPST